MSLQLGLALKNDFIAKRPCPRPHSWAWAWDMLPQSAWP